MNDAKGRTLIGLDPSTSGYLGIAVAHVHRPDHPIGDIRLHRIRAIDSPERTYRERAYPVLAEALHAAEQHGHRVHIRAEVPPPTSRRDAGPRTGQAAIGYPLGLITGYCLQPFVLRGDDVQRISVATWRSTLRVWAGRHGLVVREPDYKGHIARRHEHAKRNGVSRTERLGGGRFLVHFRDCDHDYEAKDYETLTRVSECPTCMAGTVAHPNRGEWVRDRWKQTACQVVEHFWPRVYADVVTAAQRTAKSTKPDHRYAGVSDACEAACMLLHADVEGA